jgi:hypothetical protein
MYKNLSKNSYLLIFFLSGIFLLSYIFINTGIQGDEYFAINEFKKTNNINRFISLENNVPMQHIFAITDYYLRWWLYYAFLDGFPIVYDFGKIFFNFLTIYFVYTFLTIFFDNKKSLLLSIAFVFFPNHEATVFTYMTILHVFGPSTLMLCYYLIYHDKKIGYYLLYPACFLTYANPPFMLGLGFLFLLKKKIKKFILFSIPCLIYLIFYLTIAYKFPGVEKRLDSQINLVQFIKNFSLQIITLFDSFIGPSFFIKIIYSYREISLLSVFIAFVISLLLIIQTNKIEINKKKNFLCKKLILSALIVFFSSVIMFSMTGLYNYTPFNHANRANIYFCFFIIIILGFLFSWKIQKIFFIFIIIFPILGLSDHWKKWNNINKKIIFNISKLDLTIIKKNDLILISGNNFSKMNNIAHIEFFVMPWHTKALFEYKKNLSNVYPITDSLIFKKDFIFDDKYNYKLNLNDFKHIYLYDTDKNIIRRINYNIDYLNSIKPKYKRHWIQILNIIFLNKIIIFLSPRLNYLFIN